jgi:hypothetical protein
MEGAQDTESPAGPPEGGSSEGGGRARLLFAGGLAGLLAIGAIVLIASSGSAKHEFTAAPEQCIDGWNDDSEAVTLGTHQYDVHGYNRVQVTTLRGNGSAPAPESDPKAICAVLFASPALDAEIAAAVSVQLPEGWRGLDVLQPPERLGEYQAQAQEEYNAELQQDGSIEPL